MVDLVLRPLLDVRKVMGLTVALVIAPKTAVFGVGATGGKPSRVPNGRTIYEMVSVSKVFTAILLADAARRGELALDDPVSRFLPAEL